MKLTLDFSSGYREAKRVLIGFITRLAMDFQMISNKGIEEKTKEHLSSLGKSYYNPNKVVVSSSHVGIDIPGICRAYHSHTIVPKRAKWLKIPLSGKSRNDNNKNTFTIPQKGKDGRLVVSRKPNGELEYLYVLKKKVFQKQNPHLLPSDRDYIHAIGKRLDLYLGKGHK